MPMGLTLHSLPCCFRWFENYSRQFTFAIFLVFTDWHIQMLEFVNKNRHRGVLKLKILETTNIIIFKPEDVEALLASSELASLI